MGWTRARSVAHSSWSSTSSPVESRTTSILSASRSIAERRKALVSGVAGNTSLKYAFTAT